MRHHLLVAAFLGTACSALVWGQTDHIVISEFATRGPSAATDEFVELYNPTANDVSLSGWKLQYKAATSSTWNDRAILPSNATVAAHGFYLLANQSYLGTVTPDYSSSLWTSASGMADNGHVRIINASSVEIDKVGYGSTAIDPEGGIPAPNHGTSANGNSVERKALSSSTADSLGVGGNHALLGNGYDSNVNGNDFVTQTHGRNPQNTLSAIEPPSADGSGSATMVPDTLYAYDGANIQITYRRNPTLTITDMRIVIPTNFVWSHSLDSVTVTNMTSTNSISGDTIYFNSLTLTADSNVITIDGMSAPDSTALYSFRVQTKGDITYRDVNPTPKIVVFGVPSPIADVKTNDANGVPLKLGQLVTIEGIVTVANEFGGPSFVQDNSGGIAIFGSSFSSAVQPGDEVKVSGIISPFNGLCELGNPILHGITSSGNVVSPTVVTCVQLSNDGQGGLEQYEGLLVRVNVVTVADTNSGSPPSTWNQCGSTSGCNYRITDASGHVDIRADNNTDFFVAPAPQATFSVIGVLSQFKAASPFIGGYQLMPRSSADLLTSGPLITSNPVEDNIQQTSFRVSWATLNASTSRLRYGMTPAFELGVIAPDDSMRTLHSVAVTGLSPATIYYVQAFSVAGADTSAAGRILVSTASPSGSTEQVNVYFNKSVNASLAWFQPANGNTDFVAAILPHINSAQRSIDVALYSLSGTPGSSIATALVNAKNRGVKVRVICEDDNRNTAPFNTIAANGIPLITDRFDPINNGAGLMHNKFFVFDGRGGAPESVWVWMGSWNPTDPGTNSDYQNVVELQDVALANAYTIEFNEMWGSDTDVPNASNSRFGARKTDNTPHRFVIGGREIQSYFSPSDHVTSKIISTLTAAEHSIGFQLLTFTRSDIASTIVARKNAGKSVRGDLDNNTDTGNQYSYLVSNGIDVRLNTGGGLLHHKYAVIDAEDPHWNSTTITGSHNWSSAAENANNENTLIIHDGNVTNQFLQEFAARYYQFGGTDSILVGVQNMTGVPVKFALHQNYPNPFNPKTTIVYDVPFAGKVSLTVYNVLGQQVASLIDRVQTAGRYRVEFDASRLSSGVYFYRMRARPNSGEQSGDVNLTKKMLLLK